jgi:hypothetical protein
MTLCSMNYTISVKEEKCSLSILKLAAILGAGLSITARVIRGETA